MRNVPSIVYAMFDDNTKQLTHAENPSLNNFMPLIAPQQNCQDNKRIHAKYHIDYLVGYLTL